MNSEAKALSIRAREFLADPDSIAETEELIEENTANIEPQMDAHDIDQKIHNIQEAITETYLTLWFKSEGATPTTIAMRLQRIGFKPVKGKHDFVYDWKRQIGLEEIFKLGDTVSKTLKGLKVLYKLETV
ncbi:MAG: hypothetical protein JSV35_01115 [Candidatus Bathyarchaeota archaeon]|nr:MAG: hypothetical protein JSV35_01115 [Candidatus Bathyarchaeota archaeon]